jgi:2-polyprenyl-3-methyl-5-hydroxy-6-metoxy-1,4-benzoquinol methylase
VEGARSSQTAWPADELESVGACPVCRNTRRRMLHEGLADRLFGSEGRWSLQQCTRCAAAYLDPRPTAESLHRAYRTYYTHTPPLETVRSGLVAGARRRMRNGYLNARLSYDIAPASRLAPLVLTPLPLHRREARLVVRDLRYLGPTSRLLDVGCGNGQFLVEAQSVGWDAVGIDNDSAIAEAARDRGLQIRVGSLDELRLPDASFDAITMAHVLEHVPEPMSLLAECRRLLKTTGRLWIATPNLASPGHRRYGRDWRGLEPPRHLVLFTARALRLVFGAAGFEIALQDPPRCDWMHRQSEALLSREGSSATSRRVARRLRSAAQDLCGLASHEVGEELIALGRPRLP